MEEIIFKVFEFLGGLAFFLFGMNVMSSGLEKTAGGKMESVLLKMTSNRVKAMGFGAGITAVIQSSSAMTVMLVGLVNAGLMEFRQTIGVLMGSNIGTTITAWILSLAGIEGDAWYLTLLKPVTFSAVFAFIGILLHMFSKKEKYVSIGSILLGFAVLMFGMEVMAGATSGVAESDVFESLIGLFKNPLLGVLIGALFTGIIQSSSASVGILQTFAISAFASSNPITYSMALPVIMGQNIGTCVTALISSLGVSKNAKKVSVVHLTFNITGTLIFLIPLVIIQWFDLIPALDNAIGGFEIAVCHTIFNVVTTLVLLPFAKQLENFANKVIPVEEKETVGPKLDDRLLEIPAVAIASANDSTVTLSHISIDTFLSSMALMDSYSAEKEKEIKELEEVIDTYEDKLGTYMVKLSREDLSVGDSKTMSKILHTINDFERIGDHACNLAKVAREIDEKKIAFSDEAVKEIAVLTEAIKEILSLTGAAFAEGSVAAASKVEPLEQVIDKIISNIKKNHIDRLQSGNCTIEHGFVLHDLLTNYERVSDHCSNIAVAIIETAHGSFDTHEYLHSVKADREGAFGAEYEAYKARFIK